MENKQLAVLTETVAGLVACQSILFQFIVVKGIAKREEVGLALDGLIERSKKQYPNSEYIISYIKDLRENINSISPLHYPDWLRDLTDGGDQGNKP